MIRNGIVIALAVLAFVSCGKKSSQDTNTPDEYVVETVATSSSEQSTSYPATIKGKQDIEIRPKVSGFITKLCVDEGSTVKQGQPLFMIDRVQYEAQVKSAKASVEVAKASLNTMKLTVENKRELHKRQIISDFDLQTALDNLASAEAQLAQAKANLTNALEQLSYCTVVSPSNGVVGEIPYRVGSLVSSASATPLTTVSNIAEMYVYFSMTEKQLLEMTRNSGNVKAAISQLPSVKLKLTDGTIYAYDGKVETVSGVIDQNTGSVSMRATFPNPKHELRSGGTGSILIPQTYNAAIVIPQKATYEIQDKKFVYVVGKDNRVTQREIEVASENDGKNYIVTSGLESGERIVVEGVNTLKNDMVIKPITAAQSAKNFQQALQDEKDGKLPF